MSNKSVLLFLHNNRTCERCAEVYKNITNATTDFMELLEIFSMDTERNKSPYCHVVGQPRLVLFQNQS